jgi:hypothetical protein
MSKDARSQDGSNETVWKKELLEILAAGQDDDDLKKKSKKRKGGIIINRKYEYKNRERKCLSYLYFLERKMTGENMKEEATRHTTALWRVYRGWMFVSPIAF